MEFGRLPVSELGNVDFSFVPDPQLNTIVLPGQASSTFKMHLGLTSWGRTEWVGKIYPPKTKEKVFLEHYCKQFNSIELNATHYKIYSEHGISVWHDRTNNNDFIFCPKLAQDITHKGPLTSKEQLISEFITGIKGFKEKLGPIFISFAESFSPKRQHELLAFLKSLPTEVSYFLEVRHPDWYKSNELFQCLYENKIGAVITDTAGRRDCVHMYLTVPKVFIRFVANDSHPTDFKRIDAWAKRILGWKEKGLEDVYFFVHSHDEVETLNVARYAIETFNTVLNAKLKPLQFYKTNALW